MAAPSAAAPVASRVDTARTTSGAYAARSVRFCLVGALDRPYLTGSDVRTRTQRKAFCGCSAMTRPMASDRRAQSGQSGDTN